LKITSESVAKIANTETITTAALVTTPAVLLMPCEVVRTDHSPRILARSS